MTTWILVPPRSTPPRLAMASVCCADVGGRLEQLLHEVDALHQAADREELVAHARHRRLAHAARRLRVLQQSAHGRAVGGEGGGVVEQDPGLAVDDLVLDPAAAAPAPTAVRR